MRHLGLEPSSPILSITVDAPPGSVPRGWRRLRYTSIRFKGLIVGQFPNPVLAVWLAAALISLPARGDLESVSSAVATVALAAWAYSELSEGVNWFRRLLGAAVLVYLVAELSAVLPA